MDILCKGDVSMHLKKAAAGVGSLVTGVVRDVTTHWKRPAPGNFVSYREIVSLGLGGMGNQFTMVLVGYLALNAGNTLLGSTIGIRPVHLQIMLTIQTILNVFFYFVRAKIVDNTRTKWGRFRPYIAFMGIPLAMLSIVFVFLPFQTMSYRDKLVWVFVFAIAVSMISPLFTDTYSELQTVISPNSEERAKVLSINSIIYSAAPTLTGLFVPILSNLTGGYTNINTYRYVLAPVTLIGLGLNFFTAIGCRERIVTSSTYVQKVGIFEGTWMILQNKHWWLRTVSGLIGFLESATGVLFSWIYIYSVQDMTMYGILNTVMGTASGIAMFITPFLLKWLGNKKLLITHNVLNIVFLLILIFTYRVPAIMFLLLYFNSLVNGLSIVYNQVMHSEVKDYQQYICGYRMDFVFGLAGMVTMPISLATGYVIPYVYEYFGLTTNYDVLYDPMVRNTLFTTLCVLSVIGAVLNLIPFCFYSLSKEKHQNIIRVLRYRALFDDYESGSFDPDIVKNGVEAVRSGLELAESPVPDLKAMRENVRRLRREKDDTALSEAKKAYAQARRFAADQAEVGIFMEEYNKFESPEWLRRVEEARRLVAGGPDGLARCSKTVLEQARALPKGTKEERVARRYDIRRAKAILRAGRRIRRYYPNGIVKPSEAQLQAAYAMPDGTGAEHKARNKAVRTIEKQFDRYYSCITPYTEAKKLVRSYETRDEVVAWGESKYDEACAMIARREQEEDAKRRANGKKKNRRQKKEDDHEEVHR